MMRRLVQVHCIHIYTRDLKPTNLQNMTGYCMQLSESKWQETNRKHFSCSTHCMFPTSFISFSILPSGCYFSLSMSNSSWFVPANEEAFFMSGSDGKFETEGTGKGAWQEGRNSVRNLAQ